MGLNPRQELFCKEYINSLNITEAAIAAGYNPNSAHVHGCKLLKKANIREYVQSLMDKRSMKLELKADDVLREIMKLSNSDVTEVFLPDGGMKPMDDWPADIRKCVSSVEVDEIWEWEGTGDDRKKTHVGYTRKVKFWDKVKCLELLGKHLKLFNEQIDVTLVVPTLVDDVPEPKP